MTIGAGALVIDGHSVTCLRMLEDVTRSMFRVMPTCVLEVMMESRDLQRTIVVLLDGCRMLACIMIVLELDARAVYRILSISQTL